MADMSQVYSALQAADAAGDTEGARQLAEYLQAGGTPRYASGAAGMQDVIADNTLAPSGSAQAMEAQSPVPANGFQGFLRNMAIGSGKLISDVDLGARQVYAQAADALSPQQKTLSTLIAPQQSRYGALQQEAADKRELDAPITGTWGGKVGQVAGALPLAFVPGANTYLGASVIGGGLGGLMPTTEGESRTLNTGIGVAGGVAGKYIGDSVSQWLTKRLAQPFMGWSQKSGNAAAAQSVGSDAEALTQPAIGAARQRFNQIFGAARDPNVNITLADPTLNALANAETGLNQSSKTALSGNPVVSDLMAHLERGSANAEQLGQVSSELGSEAASQMSSRMGDRKLGIALFKLKDHVDELIGSSIQSPELKAAYDAALPQYRNFMTLTTRPSILNSATGDVHLNNLGKYLQKYGGAGYKEGTDTSPLFQAARFGQATRLGSAPSPPILQPVKWASWHAVNNPVVNATGGVISRALGPVAPQIGYGLTGLGSLSAPLSLSYIEQ